MLWASIDIYDVSCIDVSYMLGIGRSEQTVEKSHVTCCVKNYKKNKKYFPFLRKTESQKSLKISNTLLPPYNHTSHQHRNQAR